MFDRDTVPSQSEREVPDKYRGEESRLDLLPPPLNPYKSIISEATNTLRTIRAGRRVHTDYLFFFAVEGGPI